MKLSILLVVILTLAGSVQAETDYVLKATNNLAYSAHFTAYCSTNGVPVPHIKFVKAANGVQSVLCSFADPLSGDDLASLQVAFDSFSKADVTVCETNKLALLGERADDSIVERLEFVEARLVEIEALLKE